MTVKIEYTKKEDFYKVLKARIDLLFTENRISKYGNTELYIKSIILFGSWIMCLYFILSGNISPPWRLGECALLGILTALLNFNIMHDASHGAYSSRKWVNTLLAMTLNLVGGSEFMWYIKHVILHHSFVNTDHDDDIITRFFRMSPNQKWRPGHQFQHLYAIPLYSVLYLQWIWYTDFERYFKQKVHLRKIKKMSLQEHIVFWVTKIGHFLLFIRLPYLLFGWNFIFGYLIYAMILGLVISLVFQLAHVHEHAHFTKDNNGIMPTSFGEQQVLETMDFGTKSEVLTWSLGGLNFQTIHHLFPWISHVHYKMMQPTVKNTCLEFGIPYTSVSSWGALKSHFVHLKKLGKNPYKHNND